MDDARYKEYLNSNSWKNLKAKVIKRDGGICQGCFLELPLDVHHLTYERIGDELGVDLISLCRQCHDRIHLKPSYSSNKWKDYMEWKTEKKPKDFDDMTEIEKKEYILKEYL